MIIIGAGMAGLIAAHMLRRYEPVVWEAQPSLPDNHGALLRFRTDVVARNTGIPFRKVHVTKAVKTRGRLWQDTVLTPDLHNRYSLKVTGEVRSRSIVDLTSGARYIAPDDFLAALARGVHIEFSKPFDREHLREQEAISPPAISTMPMSVLMDMSGWDAPAKFPVRPVWSVTVTLPYVVDVYQTVYYPGREPYYRASITGRKLIIEYAVDPNGDWRDSDEDGGSATGDVLAVFEDFGFGEHLNPMQMSDPQIKYHAYGKILPIDEDLRRSFILAMTDRHAVYSLGRFATWRQLVLDDIVKDVHVIEQFVDQRASYHRRLFYGWEERS